jgi:hypothetical protein
MTLGNEACVNSTGSTTASQVRGGCCYRSLGRSTHERQVSPHVGDGADLSLLAEAQPPRLATHIDGSRELPGLQGEHLQTLPAAGLLAQSIPTQVSPHLESCGTLSFTRIAVDSLRQIER